MLYGDVQCGCFCPCTHCLWPALTLHAVWWCTVWLFLSMYTLSLTSLDSAYCTVVYSVGVFVHVHIIFDQPWLCMLYGDVQCGCFCPCTHCLWPALTLHAVWWCTLWLFLSMYTLSLTSLDSAYCTVMYSVAVFCLCNHCLCPALTVPAVWWFTMWLFLSMCTPSSSCFDPSCCVVICSVAVFVRVHLSLPCFDPACCVVICSVAVFVHVHLSLPCFDPSCCVVICSVAVFVRVHTVFALLWPFLLCGDLQCGCFCPCTPVFAPLWPFLLCGDLQCGKGFTDNDIVVMNGNDEDTTLNKYKMDYRRMQARLAKVSWAPSLTKSAVPAFWTMSQLHVQHERHQFMAGSQTICVQFTHHSTLHRSSSCILCLVQAKQFPDWLVGSLYLVFYIFFLCMTRQVSTQHFCLAYWIKDLIPCCLQY